MAKTLLSEKKKDLPYLLPGLLLTRGWYLNKRGGETPRRAQTGRGLVTDGRPQTGRGLVTDEAPDRWGKEGRLAII